MTTPSPSHDAGRKQWRIVYAGATGSGACFIDAATESGARKLFSVAFPSSTLMSIKLEEANPCPQYEKREM